MADLSLLRKRVSNSPNRQTSAFIRATTQGAPDTYAFHSFGRIKAANINIEPNLTEMDVTGRDSVLTYDGTVSFALMQNSATEISAVGGVAANTGYDQDNGQFLFLSARPITEVTSVLGDGIPDDLGFGFKNVFLKPTMEIDLGGGESIITVEFSFRVKPAAIEAFNDGIDGEILVVDA